MRLRFGALALRPRGAGVSTYEREFLRAVTPLLPHAELSAVVQRDAISELPCGVRPVPQPVGAGALRAALGLMPVRGVDIVHSLDVDLPVYTSALRVATVHDMSVFDTPGAYPRSRAMGERQILRLSLRIADVLIAVSEFTAERVHTILGHHCVVVPLAPSSWARPPTAQKVREVRERLRLPPKFVLQVGTVEPRKNVGLVAAAARQLGVACVLAGAGSDGTRAPAGTLGLGFVDVADLPALYSAASVVTYASKYEGFGLPPLEAMACGGAVVASRCGALPQVVGDGAVLVESQRVDDWSEALRPLLFGVDERTDLTRRALTAAGRLSWKQTAEMSLSAYRSAGAAV